MIHPSEPLPDAAPDATNPLLQASYDARHLTQGGTTAEIWLDGQRYTLRITRADKLILTK